MNESVIMWPPPNGWRKGRVLRHSAGRSFRSLSAPGDYALTSERPVWSLHCGVDPQDTSARVWTFSNGLVIKPYHSNDPILSLFCITPDTIRGHILSAAMRPALFSAELAVNSRDDLQWLDTEHEHVVLLFGRAGSALTFSVTISTISHEDALEQARAALDTDPLEVLYEQIRARAGFWNRLQTQEVNEPLIVTAQETLRGALHDPQETLPHRWSESHTNPGALDLNALFPLTTAWCALDPAIADDLVRSALSQVQSNGFLPARVGPDGRYAEDAMAWPTLALSVQRAAQAGAAADLVDVALPPLAAYLGHALERFARNGHFTWRSPDEAFIPETFDLDLATVDLATFLLCEVDAYLEMADRAGYHDPAGPFIREQRAVLQIHLTKHLWDEQAGAFRDCYIDGTPIKRTTLSGFLPLLWRGLDEERRTRTLKKLQNHLLDHKEAAVGLWEYWDDDPETPPAPALHQTFVLEAVRQSGDRETRAALETALRNTLSKHFVAHHAIPDDLAPDGAIARNGSDSTDGAALAIALEFPMTGQAEPEKVSGLMSWLDRHRVGVLSIVLGVIVLALSAVIVSYLLKRTPTNVDMETMTSLAERHYNDGRYEQAIDMYRELAEAVPNNRNVRFLLANALFRDGQLDEAIDHYRLAYDEDNPSPRVIRNLAIALYMQANYTEAALYFQQIIDLYAERYPPLAEQARVALGIIEGHLSEGSE